MNSRRRISNFTLIEMLVVIAIISILASILMPALQSTLTTAKAINCSNNLKQVMLAFHAYGSDYNGLVPSGYFWNNGAPLSWSVHLLNGNYIEKGNVLCPAWQAEPGSSEGVFVNGYRTYGVPRLHLTNWNSCGVSSSSWRTGDYYSLNKLHKPSQIFLVADIIRYNQNRQWYHFHPQTYATESTGVHLRHMNKCNMGFVDGHVEGLDFSELYGKSVRFFVNEDLTTMTF